MSKKNMSLVVFTYIRVVYKNIASILWFEYRRYVVELKYACHYLM